MSGGGKDLSPESAAMAEFLADLGVRPDAVIQESTSRNTVENALHTKPVLALHQMERVLLVTSALHMPRALAIFKAVGIQATPASADVEVVAERNYRWVDFVPSSEALGRTTRVIKELLGLAGHRLQLWIAAGGGSAFPIFKV